MIAEDSVHVQGPPGIQQCALEDSRMLILMLLARGKSNSTQTARLSTRHADPRRTPVQAPLDISTQKH